MTDKARLSNEAERMEARAPEAEIRRAASIYAGMDRRPLLIDRDKA